MNLAEQIAREHPIHVDYPPHHRCVCGHDFHGMVSWQVYAAHIATVTEREPTITVEQRDEAIRAASRELTKQARQWPGDGLIHDAIPFELADAAVRRALESLGITVARGEGS